MEVVFAEVLSPMRYTVNLIDDESVNLTHAVKLINRAEECRTFHDLLRCQVHQFVADLFDLLVEMTNLLLFLLRVAD